jgi:hypothetical protein
MTEFDDRLRTLLATAADEAQAKPLVTQAVYRGARRRRYARRGAAALVCAALATAGIALSGVVGTAVQLPAAAPDGPFLGWGTMSDARSDQMLTAGIQAWDAVEGSSIGSGPHTEVHPLLLRQDSLLGPVAIVEARNAAGDPRLAIFTGQPRDRVADQKLVLRSDRPAPDPATTSVVSLVTARVGIGQGDLPPAASAVFVLALATPGVDEIQVDSTAVDDALGEGLASKGRWALHVLTPNASSFTTAIDLIKSGHKVVTYDAAPDSGIGDPQVAKLSVTSRDGGVLTTSALPGAKPAELIGRFVVSHDGLVGRVKAADSQSLVVELSTSASFSVAMKTNISNIRAQGSGDGASHVRLSHFDGTASINKGNRVVLDSDSFSNPGPVTVGWAANTCETADHCDGLEVVPSTNFASLTTIYLVM